MALSQGDRLVPVQTADGKISVLKCTPATSEGDRAIPVITADGKLSLVKCSPITIEGQRGIPVILADGKIGLVRFEQTRGRLLGWGSSSSDRLITLGTGVFPTPAWVWPDHLPDVNIVDVAAGYDHALAVFENGDCYAWGNDNNGQRGRGGSATFHPWPTPVVDESTLKTSGILEVGKRYWINTYNSGDDFTNVGGQNSSNNLFTATGTTPANWTNGSKLLEPMKNVVKCFAGQRYSCIVTKNPDKVYAFGLNRGDESWLGTDSTLWNVVYPTEVIGITDVLDMTTGWGYWNPMYLLEDGIYVGGEFSLHLWGTVVGNSIEGKPSWEGGDGVRFYSSVLFEDVGFEEMWKSSGDISFGGLMSNSLQWVEKISRKDAKEESYDKWEFKTGFKNGGSLDGSTAAGNVLKLLLWVSHLDPDDFFNAPSQVGSMMYLFLKLSNYKGLTKISKFAGKNIGRHWSGENALATSGLSGNYDGPKPSVSWIGWETQWFWQAPEHTEKTEIETNRVKWEVDLDTLPPWDTLGSWLNERIRINLPGYSHNYEGRIVEIQGNVIYTTQQGGSWSWAAPGYPSGDWIEVIRAKPYKRPIGKSDRSNDQYLGQHEIHLVDGKMKQIGQKRHLGVGFEEYDYNYTDDIEFVDADIPETVVDYAAESSGGSNMRVTALLSNGKMKAWGRRPGHGEDTWEASPVEVDTGGRKAIKVVHTETQTSFAIVEMD